jgi:hypothetical protein
VESRAEPRARDRMPPARIAWSCDGMGRTRVGSGPSRRAPGSDTLAKEVNRELLAFLRQTSPAGAGA